MAAAECARAGGSIEEVIDTARKAAHHTRAFALLASVDPAVQGGRVPPIARTLSRLLDLSIVLATQSDGRVKLGGALWGRARLLQRFARFVAERTPPSRPAAAQSGPAMVPSKPAEPRYRILIGHGNAEGAASLLSRELALALPASSVERSLITDMGTALGVHGGAGTLIVGLQTIDGGADSQHRSA
jgi:fatty acid-binding protein DegV